MFSRSQLFPAFSIALREYCKPKIISQQNLVHFCLWMTLKKKSESVLYHSNTVLLFLCVYAHTYMYEQQMLRL